MKKCDRNFSKKDGIAVYNALLIEKVSEHTITRSYYFLFEVFFRITQ